jgi:hypothetical protein
MRYSASVIFYSATLFSFVHVSHFFISSHATVTQSFLV